MPSAPTASDPLVRQTPAGQTPPGQTSPGLNPTVIADVLVASAREFSRFLEDEVGSRAVSHELLREAFGRGPHNVAVLNSRESAISWFYRLLRNAVIDQPRSEGSSEPRFAAFRASIEQQLEPGVALASAIRRYVGGLLGLLESDHAAALRNVELDGASIDDYAEASGISKNVAGVRVSEARAALRRRVVSSSGICMTHGRWNCTCGLAFVGYGQARARETHGE
jgi:RNA polymerase sigma-70 factor (ECF subfamily)